MLLNNLKFGLRTLARDRFFSAVNLLGLAVGLASVAFILLYVRGETSYDSWLPDSGTLYRIDTRETVPGQEPVRIAAAPGPLSGALTREFPEIEEITRAFRIRTNVVRDNRPSAENLLVADPNFFRLMGLPFAAGSADSALRTNGSAAIRRSAAIRIFGNEKAVGKRLTAHLPDARDYIVGAVFEDIPENSHLDFDVVVPFQSYFGANTEEIRAIPDNWGGAYFHTYARLRPGAAPSAIEARMPDFVDRNLPQWLTGLLKSAPHDFYRFSFVNVRDVHFDGADVDSMKPPGNRAGMVAISFVAILILLIACVNFANLSMARSTLRAREVGLRKVLGANRFQIFEQFIGEAVLITAIAGLIAMALVELTVPVLGPYFGLPEDTLRENHVELALGMVALILATALLSSLYPSAIISRIKPAAALSRDNARRTGGRIRSLLVVLQFAVSIGLITTTTVMVMQTRFARSASLGFDSRNMLILRVPERADRAASVRSLAEALRRNPDVTDVAVSSAVPTDQSEDNISIQLPGSPKPIQLGIHQVDSSFFGTFGVAAIAGRTSSALAEAAAPEDGAQPTAPIVVNRSALVSLGYRDPGKAIGQVLRTGSRQFEIVGVVPDIHFRSLHQPVRPEIYRLAEDAGGVISVRYNGAELRDVVTFVEASWRDRLPDVEIDRAFLEDRVAALYDKEGRQSALLSIFAAVALILSCLGLLAMAAFSVQRRTGEIAIRKVLGARTPDILRLLLWEFTRPVVVANIIAWPAAYYVLRTWLNQFAYRIDLPAWPFILSGLAALIVAFAAVGNHAIQVARTSPALALRHE